MKWDRFLLVVILMLNLMGQNIRILIHHHQKKHNYRLTTSYIPLDKNKSAGMNSSIENRTEKCMLSKKNIMKHQF